MSNQMNEDIDRSLSWSDDPDDIPSLKNDSVSTEFDRETSGENERDRKKTGAFGLIKTFSMMILGFVILIFVTVAWFAMNEDVDSSGMSVKAAGESFYLRVKENTNTSYVTDYTELFELADSEYGPGATETSGGYQYYKTDSGNNKIYWRLDTDDINVDTNIYNVGLHPGTSGTLSFEVVPNKDGDLNIDFSFGIRGFVATYATRADIESGEYEEGDIKSLTEVILPESGTLTDEQKALNFINGHILYFDEYNDNTEYYSVFMGDENNVYHFSQPNAVAGTAYPVEINYIWVNTIDQMILKTTDSPEDKPLVTDESTERTALIDYIKDNAANIFSGNVDVSTLDYISYKADSSLKTSMNDQYNGADQVIGVNLQYILIEMNSAEIVLENNGD